MESIWSLQNMVHMSRWPLYTVISSLEDVPTVNIFQQVELIKRGIADNIS